MFENPLALALLALLLPWTYWSLRGAPRSWRVGGTEPFEALRADRGARLRVPPSLVAGVLALLAGVLSLAGPRLVDPPLLIVRDHSLSAVLFGVTDPDGDRPAVADLGLGGEPVDEREIFDALRLHGLAPATEVWTDRPSPTGMPEGLDWSGPRPAPPSRVPIPGAVLNVWSDGARWSLHWIRLEGTGPLELVRRSRTEDMAIGDPRGETESERTHGLVGEEGIVELVEPPRRFDQFFVVEKGAASLEGARLWSWMQLPVTVSLPAGADPRWDAVVAALLPGCAIERRAAPVDPSDRSGLHVEFPGDGDPFGRLAPLEALEWMAGELDVEAERRGGQEHGSVPRPRREVEAEARPVEWPEDLDVVMPRARTASAECAAAGLLLYLLTLLLRRMGR